MSTYAQQDKPPLKAVFLFLQIKKNPLIGVFLLVGVNPNCGGLGRLGLGLYHSRALALALEVREGCCPQVCP